MTLLRIQCHCCLTNFDFPERKKRQSRTGIFHCSRKCVAGCDALNKRTTWYACEHCARIYSANHNVKIGELRSTRWCSRACKKKFQVENGRLYRDRSDIGAKRSEWAESPCEACGDPVKRRVSDVRKHVYCSRECFRETGARQATPRGIKSYRPPQQKVETKHWGTVSARVTSHGYLDLYIPEHPWARKSTRFIAAHRVIMEEHVGRYLEPDELVHHRDGQKLNNSIDNLELCRHFQPPGQRVRDQVAAARSLIARYGDLFPEDLDDRQHTLFDETG